MVATESVTTLDRSIRRWGNLDFFDADKRLGAICEVRSAGDDQSGTLSDAQEILVTFVSFGRENPEERVPRATLGSGSTPVIILPPPLCMSVDAASPTCPVSQIWKACNPAGRLIAASSSTFVLCAAGRSC
jgi:hypothetical protein